ncbi:carbohydrate-binding protein [Halomonas sp.]|uniref:carbohydrate-binding protein n=1 Tax=Halomonas sp. TaxID=1486246 RepID=UPI000C94FEC6|nr:carbohydrate-binding protein [Halomonas sp.]MAR70888.1 hypothetical protein [Halomonas sp.]
MSSKEEVVSSVAGRAAQALAVPSDTGLLVWQAEVGTIIDLDSGSQKAVTEVISGDNARPGAIDNAYVDLGRDPGDGVQYDVSVEEAGSYQLTLRYANGSNSDRPLALQVDGGVTTSVSFPGSGSWSSWQEVTVDLELEPGTHQLLLSIPTAEQGGVDQGPNLDQLTLVKVEDEPEPEPEPETGIMSFEAETFTIDDQESDPSRPADTAARLESDGVDSLRPGYSGEGYLDLGNDVGDAGIFEVTVENGGSFRLDARYANGGSTDRPMTLYIDGVEVGEFQFASTGAGDEGWERWREESLELELEAGTHTVRLENIGRGGPNLDVVKLSPMIVEAGDRETFRINFQPQGADVPEGHVADTGQAFGMQSLIVDGKTYRYGWVTEESIADGTENGTNPLSLANQGGFTLVDRSERFVGLDPRQATFAQMTSERDGFVDAGWEIELEPGFYEVTLSVGDVSGNFDAYYSVNAEGSAFNDAFAPGRPSDFPLDANATNDTEGLRSDLVTRVVEVTDGRLTLDALGIDSKNVKLQYVEIRPLPDLTPGDEQPASEDYAQFVDARAIAGVGSNTVEVDLDSEDGSLPTGVDPTSDIFVGVQVVEGRGGTLLESLSDGSVRLFETVTGIEVAFDINTTGGFDSLTLSPKQTLKPFTSYSLVIDGFQDRGDNSDSNSPTREFLKYTNTFVTGAEPDILPSDVAFEGTVELDGAVDGAFGFTSLEVSATGDALYVVSMGGQIVRYALDPEDGSLGDGDVLALALDPFMQPDTDAFNNRRGIIGIAVDPTDPQVLWVTDNYPIPLSGRDTSTPDFSGRLLKITLDEGGSFSGSAEVYLTGLPRSVADHVTNSIEFRENPAFDAETSPDEPSHLLYLTQGSNTAMGDDDSAWGNRPERLLAGAVLEVDPSRTPPEGGFDVTTEPLPDDQTRFVDDDNDLKNDPIPMGDGRFLVFGENGVASVQDADGVVLETFYDPYADDAVVKVFATGIRNAYDLVWHSNGYLYTPTNGSAAGGAVPDDPSTLIDESVTNVAKQDDYLFKVEQGGYYGHPNPLHDEFILNGGNPTRLEDINEVTSYDPGIQPDPNYRLDDAYSLGENRSANGVTEYVSDTFGDAFKGSLLFTEYSGGDDVRWITVNAEGKVIGDDVLRDAEGRVITYTDPLDIIENPATGRLYLVTLNRLTGESQLVRLDPVEPTSTGGGTDMTRVLATIQAEDNTPDDGTSATISEGGGAEIIIREGIASEVPGLQPGSFGNDGNLDDNDGVGGGYADFGRNAEDAITFGFTVEAGDGGDTVLRVRYANGGFSDRPLEVFVNGQSVGVADFPPAPDSLEGSDRWRFWMTQDIEVNLNPGEVEVRLQSVSQAGPNVDQLEVIHEPSPGFDIYEAEGALLNGARVVEVADDRNVSENAYVDYKGSEDQTITWSIRVDEAGSYEIGFRYHLSQTKSDRPLTFGINGVAQPNLRFEGLSENNSDWVYQNVVVSLKAGINTLVLTAPEAVGPNIDLLWVPDQSLEAIRASILGPADATEGTRIELEEGISALSVDPRSADFFFEVDSKGLYRLDLAANAGVLRGDDLALSLNGESLTLMTFPGAGTSGEESYYVELEPGTEYRLHIVSDDLGSQRIDYLDVTPVSVVADAEVRLESGDVNYFSDRLLFNYLEENDFGGPDRDFKEGAKAVISNDGSDPLTILDVSLDGPFVLADAAALEGLTLAPGESLEIDVLFDRANYRPPATNADDGSFFGSLRLVTNDADSPVQELTLAGFWQAQDEGGWEPTVDEVWNVAGFGNRIGGLPTEGGGKGSAFDDFGFYRAVSEEEVLSRYWTLADGVDEAKVTQIVALHGAGVSAFGLHAFKNTSQDIKLIRHAEDQNQSFLPITLEGNQPEGTFTRDDIPNNWGGNDLFGIEVATLSSDPSLNPSGAGTPPADAPDLERGYLVRLFEALDGEGNVIPDTYLVIQDYPGANHDYNDNMFVIEGIKPMYDGNGVPPEETDQVVPSSRFTVAAEQGESAQEVPDVVVPLDLQGLPQQQPDELF